MDIFSTDKKQSVILINEKLFDRINGKHSITINNITYIGYLTNNNHCIVIIENISLVSFCNLLLETNIPFIYDFIDKSYYDEILNICKIMSSRSKMKILDNEVTCTVIKT